MGFLQKIKQRIDHDNKKYNFFFKFYTKPCFIYEMINHAITELDFEKILNLKLFLIGIRNNI